MDSELEILYEDNHYIVVNKSPGDIVQGDKSGDTPLSVLVGQHIAARDAKKGAAFIGVAHRLDRPVGGVVLFAKTSKGLSRINDLFRVGEVKRFYRAIVATMPPHLEGELVHYLERNSQQNRSYAKELPTEEAKEAKLHYRVVASSENYFLLEIELLTGRHHQIRAQLAAIGCPIKGDLKYGAKRSNRGASISLYAKSLSFLHPVKKELVEVIAPPPKGDIWHHFIE